MVTKMKKMLTKKAAHNQRLATLKNHYTIKSDGAVTINLETAVKSPKFRESIALIKSHDLEIS